MLVTWYILPEAADQKEGLLMRTFPNSAAQNLAESGHILVW